MASEVRYDLRIELSDLDYPDIHVHIASNIHFCGIRGHCSLQTASKEPRRSHPASDLNLVTSITYYVAMLFWPLMATISRIL